jgi:uncharacterized protein (TIGR04255 family)
MAFEFCLDEEFPHLSKAPIVEAVLQVNARAGAEWSEEKIVPAIKHELGGSARLFPENAQSIEFNVGVQFPQALSTSFWQGVRIEPGERPEIVRFTRDLFSYSRLSPYEHWEAFHRRAMELFSIHLRIARPEIAQRIGIRFINRIQMSPGLRLEEYFTSPPEDTSGLDLPVSGFLYHANFRTPNYPYAVNVSRTVQQTLDPIKEPPSLILDIDVFTITPAPIDEKSIEGHLLRMRWLKNKVFFGSITPTLQKGLQ